MKVFNVNKYARGLSNSRLEKGIKELGSNTKGWLYEIVGAFRKEVARRARKK